MAANWWAMPGRSPHQVVLSEAERAELEHVAACYTRPHLEVQRAKLVLMAAEGGTNTEIGARLHVSAGTVKAQVSSALTKLGLDGRIQLALLAHDANTR